MGQTKPTSQFCAHFRCFSQIFAFPGNYSIWQAVFFSLAETRLFHLVKVARLQNEIAPEKLLNRYEKRFEKHEKRSEKRSETRLKNV